MMRMVTLDSSSSIICVVLFKINVFTILCHENARKIIRFTKTKSASRHTTDTMTKSAVKVVVRTRPSQKFAQEFLDINSRVCTNSIIVIIVY
jgi:hypothetical protein